MTEPAAASALDSLALTVIPAEDEALREPVREFLQQTVMRIPAHRRARSWGGYDASLSRALGERGWLGLTLPKEYGGGGRSAYARYVVAGDFGVLPGHRSHGAGSPRISTSLRIAPRRPEHGTSMANRCAAAGRPCPVRA